MSKDDEGRERLEAARNRAELRLAELRQSLKSEVGWAPASRSWLLLTLALSSGMALAFLIRSRKA